MTARRYSSFFLFFFITMAFFFISLTTAGFAFVNNGRIIYGVESGRLPLSGLSEQAAAEKIAALCQEKLTGTVLHLEYNGRSWQIRAEDIALQADPAATAAAAYGIGRSGGIFTNARQSLQAAWSGAPVPLVVRYDEAKLQTILQQIAREIDLPSENARCQLQSDGRIEILPEKNGRRFAVAAFAADIREKLLSLDLPQTMPLSVQDDIPAVGRSDLDGIDTVLASYSTDFDSSDQNRSENLRLGARSLENLLLRPQQILSFNDTVGRRSAAAGYKDAPVLIDGEMVPGIGGGICQVSSTLYNAILLADLKAVERDVHFYPSTYVPIGFDATVADDLLDFKFQNTLPHNIYLLTRISGHTLTVYVLGQKSDRPAYELRLTSSIEREIAPETITRYDASLPAGTRRIEAAGKNGYVVSAYRLHLQNGREISRELLHRDEYTPKDRIVVIGTK